jgi:hypothetical protein
LIRLGDRRSVVGGFSHLYAALINVWRPRGLAPGESQGVALERFTSLPPG